MSTRIPARAYHVDFDTLDMPGALVAVEVTISKRIGRDKDVFNVGLRDDPLYERLWRYCQNNPPRSKENLKMPDLTPGAVQPTPAQIDAAAVEWCRDKERETFHDDILYFRYNWRYLPGLRAYVVRAMEGCDDE